MKFFSASSVLFRGGGGREGGNNFNRFRSFFARSRSLSLVGDEIVQARARAAAPTRVRACRAAVARSLRACKAVRACPDAGWQRGCVRVSSPLARAARTRVSAPACMSAGSGAAVFARARVADVSSRRRSFSRALESALRSSPPSACHGALAHSGARSRRLQLAARAGSRL